MGFCGQCEVVPLRSRRKEPTDRRHLATSKKWYTRKVGIQVDVLERFGVISFFVQGKPATQGSKRAIWNKKANRAMVLDDNPQNKPWRSDVRDRALEAMNGALPLEGPIELVLQFRLARPKGHFKSGHSLRGNAPSYPCGRPDGGKMARSVEDACTGVIWVDDSQVVRGRTCKDYSDDSREGVLITISRPMW